MDVLRLLIEGIADGSALAAAGKRERGHCGIMASNSRFRRGDEDRRGPSGSASDRATLGRSTTADATHRRIIPQALGVIYILVAGKAAEQCLPDRKI
jgi:hypothetical protein